MVLMDRLRETVERMNHFDTLSKIEYRAISLIASDSWCQGVCRTRPEDGGRAVKSS